MKRLIIGAAVGAFLCGVSAPAWAGVVDGIPGLQLWLDAGNIVGLSDGDRVDLWPDASPAARDATRQEGSPTYIASVPDLNGQPVVRFTPSGTSDWFSFGAITDIRTVFWVLSEDSEKATGWRFILGHNSSYNFHRASTDGGPLWNIANGWAHANVINGTTMIDGQVVDGTAVSPPQDEVGIVSLVTAGNVEANQLTEDRGYSRSWVGDIAEVIIYNTALTDTEVNDVGKYLAEKYGLPTYFNALTWDKTVVQGDWTSSNWLGAPPAYPGAGQMAIVENEGAAATHFLLLDVTTDEAAGKLIMKDPGPDPDYGNYIWLRRTTGWNAGAPDDTFGSLTVSKNIDGGAANDFLVMDQGTSVSTGTGSSQISALMYFGFDTHPGPDGTPGTGDDVTIPIDDVVVNTPGDLKIVHRLDDATLPGDPSRTLVKRGAGTLDLTSAEMLTGSTEFRIEEGTVVTLGPDPLGGGSLDLAGGNLVVNAPVILGAAPATPQAYYSFNNSGVPGLNSGTAGPAADGDLRNGAAWTANGVSGGGAEFFGDDDYMSAELDVSETAYGAAMWFKADSPSRGLMAVVDADLGGGGHDRHIYLTGGNVAVRTWSDETISTSGLSLADGQWHHVAYTFGGTEGGAKIYIDGVLSASGGKANSDFDWQKRINVGFSNDAAGDYFDGVIDEVYVYDRALTAADVAVLTGEKPLDLGTLDVVVNASSGFSANASGTVPVGTLLLREGVVTLDTTADLLEFSGTEVPAFSAPEDPPDSRTVGVNILSPAVDIGIINFNNSSMTFLKQGVNLDLNPANTGLAATGSLVADGGPMTTVGTAPLGDAAIGASLGGEFRIASSGGDLTVNNAIIGDVVDVELVYGLEPSGTFYDVHGHASRIDPLQSGDGALTLVPDVGPKPLDTRMYWYNNDEVPNWFGGATGDDWVAVFQLPLNVGGPNLPAGDISFGTESDDGSMLFIDLNGDGIYDSSEAIVSNNGDHGRQQRTGSVNLDAGVYNVAIGVYERGGGDNLVAVFGSGSGLGWGSMTVIDPTDPGQAGVWDPTAVSEVRNYALLTAGIFDTVYDTASGVGEKVILANFNPDGVVGLNAIDGYSFEIPNAVNAPTGGFATLAGETVVQKALNVQYLDLGEGLFTRAGVGADRAITIAPGGSLILSDQSLDMSADPFSLATDSEVFIGDGQTLTMVGPFECGTLNLVGSLVFSSGLEQITVNDAFNIFGADVDTTGMILDVSTAVVTIGKERTLTDDNPAGLVASGLDVSEDAAIQLVGPSQSVSVDTLLRLNAFTLDTTGSTLTTTANTVMELTSAAIVADQSLLADTLTMSSSSITLPAGASIDVATAVDLQEATITADLLGPVDVVIDERDPTDLTSLLGDGSNGAYSGNTTIIRGGLAVSENAASLGTGNVAFNSSDSNLATALLGSGAMARDIGPGAGEMDFVGAGGFGAKGGDFVVTLEGGATLDWGSATAGFNGQRLVMGHREADSVVEITNPIELNGNRWVQLIDNPDTDQDVVKFSGVISDGATSPTEILHDGYFEQGEGVAAWYSAPNTFTGTLRSDEGAIRAEDGVGLPAGANLRLGADANRRVGGIFESWGTFTRNIGTGPGEVQFAQAGGGFAAWNDPDTVPDETLTVTLNGGATLDWETDFVSNMFMLGSRTANSVVEVTNDLTDGNNNSQIVVFDNPHSDQDAAKLTGVLTTGILWVEDLVAHNGGVLWLTNPANSVNQWISLEDGILRGLDGAGVPSDCYVQFRGHTNMVAIWESWDTDQNDPTTGIRRPSDVSGPGGLDWESEGGRDGSGGFAAWSGHLTVALDDGAPLNWGSHLDGMNLQLNSPSADDVVTLTNDINLSGNRTVRVWDNPFKTTDWAVMSGDLTSGSLTKTNAGRLDLTGNNNIGLTLNEGLLNTTGNNTISTLTVNAGELNMTGDDTIDEVVVNDGVATFAGTNSLGTVDVLGGSLLATVGAALGDGSAEVTIDGASLALESGSASAVGIITANGATLSAGAGATLTLTPPALPTLGGDVLKQGPGTVNLENHQIIGNVTVAEGTLGVGPNILGFNLPGAETLTVGENAALGTAGSVNRRVVSTGTGAAVVANADSDIGLLSETDGWGFVGAMEVGPHTVGLKDADEAELYGAHMAGGTISSFNGIRLLPINISDGLNSRLYGYGTVNGNVVAGIEGNPTPAVVVADPGQTIELTGVVQTGNSTFVNNVVITGTERLGFSPAVGMKLGGAPIGPDAVVEVYGTAGADFESEIPDALAPPVADPLSGYGQFYVAGGESLVSGKITLSTGGSDYVGRGGDTFELIVTGQAWLMDFTQFPPQNVLLPEGSVNIDPGFIVDTSGIPLASPGLFWQEFRSDQGLTLKIVPEPGTLVLLLTGGLGLLVVWRRRQ